MVTETLGFVGLGNMGAPMAANLAAAGCDLSVHDKAGTSERAPEGAAAAASPAEVAEAATAAPPGARSALPALS